MNWVGFDLFGQFNKKNKYIDLHIRLLIIFPIMLI